MEINGPIFHWSGLSLSILNRFLLTDSHHGHPTFGHIYPQKETEDLLPKPCTHVASHEGNLSTIVQELPLQTIF